ncbi:hypothetical protein Sjap_019256 [Stephania japonica]|uniref:TRF2/HOY1 PH-like domain-containing protein n=1 Tax=Stephania japonica TaxID=461633 RepID=A0AAP0F3X4_9MAGN
MKRESKNDGDLVAKCYYAKRKLVWEMLDGGLKNKIEINWSEITAIKAVFPKNQPSVLEIQVQIHSLKGFSFFVICSCN